MVGGWGVEMKEKEPKRMLKKKKMSRQKEGKNALGSSG